MASIRAATEDLPKQDCSFRDRSIDSKKYIMMKSFENIQIYSFLCKIKQKYVSSD